MHTTESTLLHIHEGDCMTASYLCHKQHKLKTTCNIVYIAFHLQVCRHLLYRCVQFVVLQLKIIPSDVVRCAGILCTENANYLCSELLLSQVQLLRRLNDNHRLCPSAWCFFFNLLSWWRVYVLQGHRRDLPSYVALIYRLLLWTFSISSVFCHMTEDLTVKRLYISNR
jgi:hypothetical protein